jgi:hypothetical protein
MAFNIMMNARQRNNGNPWTVAAAHRLPIAAKRIGPIWSLFDTQGCAEGWIRCHAILGRDAANLNERICATYIKYGGTSANLGKHLRTHSLVLHPDGTRMITLDELASINIQGGVINGALAPKPARVVSEFIVRDNRPISEVEGSFLSFPFLLLSAPLP